MAQSQTTLPYLTGAKFTISVDDWVDVWLNGIPIIDNMSYTGADKGPRSFECLQEHICYFQKNNVLAFEVADAYKKKEPPENFAGFAYLLELKFSDGTRRFLSSAEAGNHRSYYIPDRMAGTPKGWHYLSFDDDAWEGAKANSGGIPGLATVPHPDTGKLMPFLSASSLTSKAQRMGERHLFRRVFTLNIGSSPNCPTPTADLIQTPRVKSSLKILKRTTSTPPPKPTPVIAPAAIVVPTFQAPPSSQTFKPDLPLSTVVGSRKPAAAPVPAIHPPRMSSWEEATPTVEVFVAPINPHSSSTPTPTQVVSSALRTDEDDNPGNVYMSFADGPGIYRLEVFDMDGQHVRYLFEKKVVAEEGGWAEWDGTDDKGYVVPPGRYYAEFSKDGKDFKRVFFNRKAIEGEKAK